MSYVAAGFGFSSPLRLPSGLAPTTSSLSTSTTSAPAVPTTTVSTAPTRGSVADLSAEALRSRDSGLNISRQTTELLQKRFDIPTVGPAAPEKTGDMRDFIQAQQDKKAATGEHTRSRSAALQRVLDAKKRRALEKADDAIAFVHRDGMGLDAALKRAGIDKEFNPTAIEARLRKHGLAKQVGLAGTISETPTVSDFSLQEVDLAEIDRALMMRFMEAGVWDRVRPTGANAAALSPDARAATTRTALRTTSRLPSSGSALPSMLLEAKSKASLPAAQAQAAQTTTAEAASGMGWATWAALGGAAFIALRALR